jgi:hypothetical protein
MLAALTFAMAVALIGPTSPSVALAPEGYSGQTMQDLQSAHIAANVPVGADFEAFLVRDLTAYFVGQGLPAPTVTYELLRDGPTQSGVAYPKYYVWAKAVGSDGTVVEGAARTAAIERTRFEITDFVTRQAIMANPDSLAMAVPAALRDATVERARRP